MRRFFVGVCGYMAVAALAFVLPQVRRCFGFRIRGLDFSQRVGAVPRLCMLARPLFQIHPHRPSPPLAEQLLPGAGALLIFLDCLLWAFAAALLWTFRLRESNQFLLLDEEGAAGMATTELGVLSGDDDGEGGHGGGHGGGGGGVYGDGGGGGKGAAGGSASPRFTLGSDDDEEAGGGGGGRGGRGARALRAGSVGAGGVNAAARAAGVEVLPLAEPARELSPRGSALP
jgi:hypothetical protein